MKLDTDLQPATAQAQPLTGYAPIMAAVGACVLLLIVYWDTVWSMVLIWDRSDTFAHGFVVTPLFLWLVWRKRKSLRDPEARPFPFALIAVALFGLGWLLGKSASVASVEQFSLIFMLQFATLTILGTTLTKRIMFPLVFLLFAVPAGEFLMPQLMNMTADFTVTALRFSGVPVYREGNHFVIPTGNWSVVEACSGIRYLMASVMVGSVYAYLSYRSTAKRVKFIAASIIVPLVANWLRAYLIVMIGHLSDNAYATGVDHLVYGWLFFGFVIMLMFWIGSFWRDDEPVSPSHKPFQRSRQQLLQTPLLIVAFLVTIIGGAWRAADAALNLHIDNRASRLAPLPDSGGWVKTESKITDWKPQFAQPKAELLQSFQKEDQIVGLHIAYYNNQTQGSELINFENQLVTSKDDSWKHVSKGTSTISWNQRQYKVQALELRSNQQRLAVRKWYWISGWITSNDYVAKGLLAMLRVIGEQDDSAVLILFAPQKESNTLSDAALSSFSSDMSPLIDEALSKARQ